MQYLNKKNISILAAARTKQKNYKKNRQNSQTSITINKKKHKSKKFYLIKQ